MGILAHLTEMNGVAFAPPSRLLLTRMFYEFGKHVRLLIPRLRRELYTSHLECLQKRRGVEFNRSFRLMKFLDFTATIS